MREGERRRHVLEPEQALQRRRRGGLADERLEPRQGRALAAAAAQEPARVDDLGRDERAGDREAHGRVGLGRILGAADLGRAPGQVAACPT